MGRVIRCAGALLMLSATCFSVIAAETAGAKLDTVWCQPPRDAKPLTWWHWVNGYVAKEGITADLEAMKRVGLGGFQMFDGEMGTKIDGLTPVPWGSDQWLALLRHTASEARRLGLEFDMQVCAGWSECGGPWVESGDAMQRLVWSETMVIGPGRFNGSVPTLPANFGLYQDLPMDAAKAEVLEALGRKPQARDFALLAYRLPDDVPLGVPELSISGIRNAGAACDGNYVTSVPLLPATGNTVVVEMRWSEPAVVRALTLAGEKLAPAGALEVAGNDGAFRKIAALDGLGAPTLNSKAPAVCMNFDAVTGKVFRLTLQAGKGRTLKEIQLHGERYVHNWQAKVGFGLVAANVGDAGGSPVADGCIDAAQVVDLTSKSGADGQLDWDVPVGKWRILRLGYGPIGTVNHPARREGMGLECDKLSGEALNKYMKGWKERVWPSVSESLSGTMCDSWEAGMQTWTPLFLEQFARMRGYDPKPYLPVLGGRMVKNPEISERFLRDVRRTLADLVAIEHYEVMRKWCSSQGLRSYSEAPGCGPHFADKLQCKGQVDVPAGEFWWSYRFEGSGQGARHYNKHPLSIPDCREAASAAHIYGKQIAAAEAFTAGARHEAWQQYPGSMKAEADFHLTLGINRFLFHTFAHQPFAEGRKPGVTFGPFGTHFNRNVTWWDCGGKAWVDYISRCQALLQQGRFAADILFFYGEDAPVAASDFNKEMQEMPAGYRFDLCNAEVLLKAVVRDGCIELPSGMQYRVLYIPERIRTMSPEVAMQVRRLIEDGAAVLCSPPKTAPGLGGYPRSDELVRGFVRELWGDSPAATGEQKIGKGRLFWGQSIDMILASLGIVPDLEVSLPGQTEQSNLDKWNAFPWIHRRLDDSDVYFVANQAVTNVSVKVGFRVAGKVPELWDPVSGARRALPEFDIKNGRTFVPLMFEAEQSLFIVFRERSQGSESNIQKGGSNYPTVKPLMELTGAWAVQFDSKWGGPGQPVVFEMLTDWTNRPEKGIRYYSGTAVYKKTFDFPAVDSRQLTVDSEAPDRPPSTVYRPSMWLSLGEVRDLARVRLNGKDLGVLWCAPWRVEIPEGLLQAKDNCLEVEIVNLWVNRLIGDAALPLQERLTWTTQHPYQNDSTLLSSGLLGPVQLLDAR